MVVTKGSRHSNVSGISMHSSAILRITVSCLLINAIMCPFRAFKNQSARQAPQAAAFDRPFSTHPLLHRGNLGHCADHCHRKRYRHRMHPHRYGDFKRTHA